MSRDGDNIVQRVIWQERERFLRELDLPQDFFERQEFIYKRIDELHPDAIEKYKKTSDELQTTADNVKNLKDNGASNREIDNTLARTLDDNDLSERKTHYDLTKQADDIATIREEFNKRVLGRLDELEKTGALTKEEKDALDIEKRRLNTDLEKDRQVKKAFEDTNIELDKQAKSIQEISTDIGEGNPNLTALKGKFKQIAGETPENFEKDNIEKLRSTEPDLKETSIEKASKKLKEKLDKEKGKQKPQQRDSRKQSDLERDELKTSTQRNNHSDRDPYKQTSTHQKKIDTTKQVSKHAKKRQDLERHNAQQQLNKNIQQHTHKSQPQEKSAIASKKQGKSTDLEQKKAQLLNALKLALSEAISRGASLAEIESIISGFKGRAGSLGINLATIDNIAKHAQESVVKREHHEKIRDASNKISSAMSPDTLSAETQNDRAEFLKQEGLPADFFEQRNKVYNELMTIHPKMMDDYKRQNKELENVASEVKRLKQAGATPEEMDAVIAKTLDTPEMVAEKKRHYELAQKAHDIAVADDKFIKQKLQQIDAKEKNPNLTEEERGIIQNDKRILSQEFEKNKIEKQKIEEINKELYKQAQKIQEISKDVGTDTPALMSKTEQFKERTGGQSPEEFIKNHPELERNINSPKLQPPQRKENIQQQEERQQSQEPKGYISNNYRSKDNLPKPKPPPQRGWELGR